ncbi:MAG: phytanoyl-CoA dioxygenase family protein [Candidatus Latescibacterota bacterium]|nr:phytanoyl-CoA dioxygenase family protein [Candidatus Latescibacterota bacterium]
MNDTYRIAPPGFTDKQWDTFCREGILFLENAISAAEIAAYNAAIDRVTAADERYVEGETYGRENVVELDHELGTLIDHPRHVGYAYDLFGELTKLHQSQIFLRPSGGKRYNMWHPDGARAVPYGVFSPQLPLQIKVGYWLTDLPEAGMGNLVVKPGSHRQQYVAAYDTHEIIDGEQVVCVRSGTMTIMHSSIWHRVEPNHGDMVRRNLFIAYCPAWITAADRHTSNPEWLQTLNREQRIIMRSYDHAYHNAKPPTSDFPLFLDRETGEDRDPDSYSDHVQLNRRKRITWVERHLARKIA